MPKTGKCYLTLNIPAIGVIMKQKSLLMSLFLLFAGIVAGYAQQTTYKEVQHPDSQGD